MTGVIIGVVVGCAIGIVATTIVCGRLDKMGQKREEKRKLKEMAGR